MSYFESNKGLGKEKGAEMQKEILTGKGGYSVSLTFHTVMKARELFPDEKLSHILDKALSDYVENENEKRLGNW